MQFSVILNKEFCRGTKQCNRVRCTSRPRHFQWWQLPAKHCNYVPLPPCDASEVHCSAFIEVQQHQWPPKPGLNSTLASMHPSWVGDGNHQLCTSSCPDELPFPIFNFKTKRSPFFCEGWTWLDMLCHLGSQWRWGGDKIATVKTALTALTVPCTFLGSKAVWVKKWRAPPSRLVPACTLFFSGTDSLSQPFNLLGFLSLDVYVL